MDHGVIKEMIADLEILGAMERKEEAGSALGKTSGQATDYLLVSSSGRSVSESSDACYFSPSDDGPARVITNRIGLVTSANPAFSGLSGFSFGEIRGRKPGALLQGEETEPEAVELIRQAVRKGLPCVTEMYNYRKDGTRYRVRIEIEPLRDREGNLIGFEAVETRLD